MDDSSIYVGADLTELKQEMAAGAAITQKGGEKMAAGLNHAAAGHEHLLVSSHRVTRQIGNFSQALISGGGAADVMVAGLEGLERSLHIPLGALAGLAVGAVLLEKFHEASAEAKKLHEEIKLVTAGEGDARFTTLEKLNEKLAEATKKSEELRKSADSTIMGITDMIGLTSAFGRKSDEAKLRATRGEATEAIGEKALGKAGIAETKVTQGDFAAERQKLDIEHAEKLGEAMQKFSGPEQSEGLSKMIEALSKQYVLDNEAIDHKEAAAKNAIQSEAEILYIKQQGEDVEVRSAEAKLVTARELAALATNPEEKEKAENAVKSAELVLEETKKTTAEKRAQLRMETEIANLTGSEIEKKNAALQKQRDDLIARRATAKKDEIPGIDLDLAKNSGSQRDLMESQFEKGLSGLRARSASRTGRGADEEIAAAGREMKTLNLELGNAKNLYGDNSVEVDEINAKLYAQQKRIEDIRFSQEQQLAAAKARTLEMELEASGETLAAKQAALRASYEQQIAAAQHDQNSTLAEQLKKQQQIATLQLAIADYLKTPEQRAADKAADRKAKGDEKKYKNQRDDVEREMKNGQTDFGTGRRGQIAKDILADRARQHAEANAGAQNDTQTLTTQNVQNANVTTMNVGSIPSRGKQ